MRRETGAALTLEARLEGQGSLVRGPGAMVW